MNRSLACRGPLRLAAAFLMGAGLVAAGISVPAGPAGALPAPAVPCAFSFGSLSTQGAAGTQVLEVALDPAASGQGCIRTVAVTDQITGASGRVPAGISSDGGTSSVVLLFSSGEHPAPVVNVAWAGYCTDEAQPVFLHISGAGQARVYPLGTSRPCSEGPAASSIVFAPDVRTPDPTIGIAAAASSGYRIATADTSVLRQPGSVVEGGTTSSTPIVAIAADPSTSGFWLVSSGGGVFAFNGAHFYGSGSSLKLAAPIVGMVATPTGHGYWLVGADGGVFGYGDAGFHGSTGGIRLAAPVIGIAATGDGAGYWLAAADGGVFAFGDAGFHGSAGSVPLRSAVVGIAADHSSGGYWLVAGDGGVFTYDASFHGSAGGTHLDAPVTGMAATSDSGGYWLLGGDGGVFAYGDAPFDGSGAALVEP